MTPPRSRYRLLAITNLPQLLTRLVLVSSIATVGSVNLLTAIIAAPLAPEIQIKNTAAGSFVDEDSPSGVAPTVVESNEVVVTVAEVAGIDLSIDRLPAEAPAGVPLAGADQGNGTISAGDVVYFYYKLTNTGNDPTQFFIPGTPTIAATDGSFSPSNPISIIAYDVDGNGATAPVTVNNITVPTSGQRTGASTVGGSNGLLGVNGIIPANGTVTIRVPIKIATTAGSTIAVKLGDTGATTAQNQPYSSGTGDVYTIDNPNGTLGDPSGAPINGDRESSLIQTIPVSAIAVVPVDFGDAPDTYGTLLTSPNSNFEGGARHQISSLYLGSGVSAEPNATLTGDTNDDGIIFSSNLTAPYQTIVQAGIDNNIRVTSNGSGYLNAWIDYNQDGDFSDLGERVFTNQPINDGVNNLNFTIPSTILHGSTYARFRLSPTAISTPSPTGLIVGGEVEDYRVDIADPIPTAGSCTTTGLLNGGFESPDILNSSIAPRQSFGSTIKAYYEIDVPGWNTNSTYEAVEIWQNGAGVPAYEGSQFAELNAYDTSGLFQDIATIPGQTLRWQFAHRARAIGTGVLIDTMQLNVGAPGGILSSQGTYSTDSNGWILYQGTYQVPPGQFITRFQFDALSTGSGNNAIGNFLDAVKFSTDTCVPTVIPPTIDLDGDNSTATGTSYRNRFVAGGAAVSAADSDVVITDDGANISRAVITLTTRPDTTSETLSIDPTAGGTVAGVIATTYNQTTGRLSLSGNASKADYQKIIATLKYNNTLATPTNGDRLIQVQVLDSDSAISNSAISKIVIGSLPNLLLVKRITAINSQSLNTYNQEDANPYDDNVLEPSIAPSLPTYPTADTIKWPSTIGKTSSTFLVGAISENVKPKDVVEYTIYFLSAGDIPANNVLLCDRVPANVTFIPTAFNSIPVGSGGVATADRGIAIERNGSLNSYTNTADGDIARYFPPNQEPTYGDYAQYFPAADPTKKICNGLNNDGAVVVYLGNIPKADSPGVPNTAYGFVRFRGLVK